MIEGVVKKTCWLVNGNYYPDFETARVVLRRKVEVKYLNKLKDTIRELGREVGIEGALSLRDDTVFEILLRNQHAADQLKDIRAEYIKELQEVANLEPDGD